MRPAPTIPPRSRKIQRAEHRLYTFLLRHPRAVELVLHVSDAQCPAEASHAVLLACWASWTRWLRRHYPGAQYVAVTDRGHDGYWHIHCVISRSISRQEAEQAWQRCGGAALGVARVADKAAKAAYLAGKLAGDQKSDRLMTSTEGARTRALS
jgi:hypothetical protein